MGGGKGDVGRGGVAVRRDASWEVEVEEREVTAFHSVNKQFAAGVIRGREPTDAVGVKVAHNNSIAVGMVEKREKVWSVVRRAGRGRRNVDIIDEDREVTKVDADGDGFEMLVGAEEVVHINRSKLHIMAYEDGDATPTTTLAIASEEGVTRKRRVWIVRAQFRFLEARNFDVVVAQVRRKFTLGRV